MKTGEKNKVTPGLPEADRLLKVCKLLNSQKAKYLVIGGLACNLHGLIRATKDIDLLIPKDEKNTELVLKALSQLTFGIARELDAKEVTNKPFTIVGDIPRVDLVTVANKIKYEKALPSSLKARISTISIPYVDYETLKKTKATGRLQDQADLEQLRKIKKS
jgi:hypothetical protein